MGWCIVTTYFPKIEGVDDGRLEVLPIDVGNGEIGPAPDSSTPLVPHKKTTAEKLRATQLKTKREEKSVRSDESADGPSSLAPPKAGGAVSPRAEPFNSGVLARRRRRKKATLPEANLKDLKLAPAPTQARPQSQETAPQPKPTSNAEAEITAPTRTVVAEQPVAVSPPGPPPIDPPVGEGEQAPLDDFGPEEDLSLASGLHGLRIPTDISNCLVPLLEALNWRGHPRHVAEAIPHFLDSLDITSFRNIFANLRFESWPVELSLSKIDRRLMPCLFLPAHGSAMVVLGVDGDVLKVFDGGKNTYEGIPRAAMAGEVYVFQQLEGDAQQNLKAKLGWFRAVSERFRGLIYQILGLTLMLNLLALATPLFVMAVYDKVVATGSLETLAYFAIGVVIAISCDMILRGLRARTLAYVGARLDNIVGNAVFQRILFLPASFTERATVGAQVARIKDFESIREFFTGPIALTFIELPFTVIFIVVIAVLGGPVAFVPMVMMVLFVLLGAVVQPMIQQSVAKAAKGSSRRQELMVETLGEMRAVKTSAGESKWLERYRDFSARSALNSFYISQYSALIQTISSVLMTAAGLATVSFGVFRVLGGHMTIGALVACMILVWRILAPLQGAFVSLTRLTQVKSSIGQINGLMNLKAEREPDKLVTPLNRFRGYVSLSRVSMRYSPESDPALVGVSFDVEPGEIVAIIGGNGSGKSTILKLLTGLYTQQAGSVRVDDQDLRQLDVIELRHAIAYVPQTIQFFYGTIAQNMRLTHPTASDEELRWAANEAGILEEIEALEQGSGKWKKTGFEVRIGDTGASQMPTSFLQGLNLARGYLKRSPIMLFDEPGNGLDYDGDQTFMKKIDRLRGHTTVFIVTHRPSHLKIADKIVWMDAGHIRAMGPAAEIMNQMPKNFV